MKKRIATTNNSKKTYSKFQENAVIICTFIGAMTIMKGTEVLFKKVKSAAKDKANTQNSTSQQSNDDDVKKKSVDDDIKQSYAKIKVALDFAIKNDQYSIEIINNFMKSDIRDMSLAVITREFKSYFQKALDDKLTIDEIGKEFNNFKNKVSVLYGDYCKFGSLWIEAWNEIKKIHKINYETNPSKGKFSDFTIEYF